MRKFLILTTKLFENNDIFTSNIDFCQKCSNRGFAFLFHGGGLAQKAAAAAVNRGCVRLCGGPSGCSSVTTSTAWVLGGYWVGASGYSGTNGY